MDCRTCKHNTYAMNDKIKDWVSCCHPETIAKTPRPHENSPAWINFMTADIQVDYMAQLFESHGPCAQFEVMK